MPKKTYGVSIHMTRDLAEYAIKVMLKKFPRRKYLIEELKNT